MRSVVIHYHIFKNAGSTVDAMLRSNFPSAWAALDSQNIAARLSPEALLDFTLANPGLKVISSHLARLPAPSHPDIRFFPILFLRHPMDRVGSVYAFDRRQPEPTTPGIRLAQQTDLRGYVETTLASEARVTISNFQTMWMSGRVHDFHDSDATPLDLDLALQRLAQLKFTGLVEEFDKSLELMRRYLGDSFGVLNFHYSVVNRSEDRQESLEDRLRSMRLQLGSALFDELMEKNALDLTLYQAAARRFRRRYIPIQIRHEIARSFPQGTLRGRVVRAMNRRRLELQLTIRRMAAYVRTGFVLLTTYGPRSLVQQVFRYLRRGIEIRRLPAKIIRDHPRSFASAAARAGEHELIAQAAQLALGRLLQKLDMPLDPGAVLAGMRLALGKGELLRSLDHLITFDEFRAFASPAAEAPVLQAAQLPDDPRAARRRRILFVCSQFPSAHHGGGNRVSNFIKLLSEQNDIYLCAAFSSAEDGAALAELEPYCRSVLQLSPWAIRDSRPAIRRWLAGAGMDVVHYEWPDSLKNHDPAYGPLQIFTYMEAVSLRLIMDLSRLEPLSSPWLTKFAELLHLLRLEIVSASALQARIAVTTKDAEFFRALYPFQQYTVLNHGISMDDFALRDREPEADTLVYVGNFRHYPNHDAMLFFFEQIWPRILSEIPDARIYVVGAHPPDELRGLADGRRVIVTGQVDDIRPYIQKATIGVAPLITGAGLRGKVMEYAALRRTFVATSIATTDLDFEDGLAYHHADEPAEFAGKVVELLRDPQRARAMGERAYEVVRDKYDNRRLVGYLNALYGFLEQAGQA